MPQTKAKKESLVSELTKGLNGASILVFLNFHGLSVAKERKLRNELRKASVSYKVSKKTLLKRVLESLGFADVPKLEGEVVIAAGFGEANEPPQIISKFIKAEGSLPAGRQGLKILGGVYESKFVDADVVKRLAAIPTREVLLTQLAFILTQPVAGFARALQEVSKKVEVK